MGSGCVDEPHAFNESQIAMTYNQRTIGQKSLERSWSVVTIVMYIYLIFAVQLKLLF